MTISRKIFSLLFTAIIFISITVPSLATGSVVTVGNAIAEPPLTAEELLIIERANAYQESFITALKRSRGITNKYFVMSLVVQENGYYCGPASAVMAAQAIGLGKYTQTQMANKIGTTESGSSGAQIKDAMNKLLSDAKNSLRYTRTNLPSTDLDYAISYSCLGGLPPILNVKEMPSYYSNSGHFVAVRGFYYNTDTNFQFVQVCDPHPDYYATIGMDYDEVYRAVESSNGYYLAYLG